MRLKAIRIIETAVMIGKKRLSIIYNKSHRIWKKSTDKKLTGWKSTTTWALTSPCQRMWKSKKQKTKSMKGSYNSNHTMISQSH
jgi:hypothetical protein